MKTKGLIVILGTAIFLATIFTTIGLLQASHTSNPTGSGKVKLIVTLFNNSKSFTYNFQNITALSLLEENNTVNVSNSKYGAFVNCINQVCSNNNYYWMYYINNKSANVGASAYYIKSNDIIEFRYEKA